MNFNNKFNLNKFYSSIIPKIIDDDINLAGDNLIAIEDSINKLNKIQKRLSIKETNGKNLAKIPFYLTSNSKIYVNIYENFKKIDKPKAYYTIGKSTIFLKSEPSNKINEKTDESNKNQIEFLFGVKKAVFTKKDMEKLKVIEEPSMTLLGFKSIKKRRDYYNIGESYFIYPNELYSKGAGKMIDALIRQMRNKRKCALVKFVSMDNSTIRLCYLVPQSERYDEDFFPKPPGFNMIVLPWAEEIILNEGILAKLPRTMPKIGVRQSKCAKK